MSSFFKQIVCFVVIGFGYLVVAFGTAYLLFAYLKRKTLFAEFYPKGLLGLLLASFGQWTGALVVFLLIGRLMAVDISVWSLYPMFIIATLIGMLTMVPGWCRHI